MACAALRSASKLVFCWFLYIWSDRYECFMPEATCFDILNSDITFFFSLWWLTAEDTCGGTLRGSSGLISSFDFPSGDSTSAGGAAGGLGSSGECKWTILADPGDTISLVFTEFQMEEKSDYLEVEGSEPASIWWVELWERVWLFYWLYLTSRAWT